METGRNPERNVQDWGQCAVVRPSSVDEAMLDWSGDGVDSSHSVVTTPLMSTSAPSGSGIPSVQPPSHLMQFTDEDQQHFATPPTTPPQFPDLMASVVLATDSTGGMPPGFCRAPIRQQHQRSQFSEESPQRTVEKLCFRGGSESETTVDRSHSATVP